MDRAFGAVTPAMDRDEGPGAVLAQLVPHGFPEHFTLYERGFSHPVGTEPSAAAAVPAPNRTCGSKLCTAQQ